MQVCTTGRSACGEALLSLPKDDEGVEALRLAFRLRSRLTASAASSTAGSVDTHRHQTPPEGRVLSDLISKCLTPIDKATPASVA